MKTLSIVLLLSSTASAGKINIVGHDPSQEALSRAEILLYADRTIRHGTANAVTQAGYGIETAHHSLRGVVHPNGDIDATALGCRYNFCNGIEGDSWDITFTRRGGFVTTSIDTRGEFPQFDISWTLPILYKRSFAAGDATTDFRFDSADMVQVFTAGLYETGQPGDWLAGDFTGDGLFDSGDMLAAFQAGGYEASVAAVAVPEPAYPVTLLAVALLIASLSFRMRCNA
jgi:hypothetical protein